jgi:hypothetical protein
MTNLFLGDRAISDLGKCGFWKEFILALRHQDYDELEKLPCFFLPFYAPATAATISRREIPKGSKVIVFDINAIVRKKTDRAVAMILHEVGHTLHPSAGENGADDFAVDHGFGQALVDDLSQEIIDNPESFDKSETKRRIDRVKEQLRKRD